MTPKLPQRLLNKPTWRQTVGAIKSPAAFRAYRRYRAGESDTSEAIFELQEHFTPIEQINLGWWIERAERRLMRRLWLRATIAEMEFELEQLGLPRDAWNDVCILPDYDCFSNPLLDPQAWINKYRDPKIDVQQIEHKGAPALLRTVTATQLTPLAKLYSEDPDSDDTWRAVWAAAVAKAASLTLQLNLSEYRPAMMRLITALQAKKLVIERRYEIICENPSMLKQLRDDAVRSARAQAGYESVAEQRRRTGLDDIEAYAKRVLDEVGGTKKTATVLLHDHRFRELVERNRHDFYSESGLIRMIQRLTRSTR